MSKGLGDLYEPDDPADPADAAAGWFARQRSGDLSPREAENLAAWLEADPAHGAALAAVEQTWAGAEAMRAHPRVLAMREAALKRQVPQRRTWAIRAMAASIVVAIVAGGLIASTDLLARLGLFGAQEFKTGVGQQATIRLADGSTVVLNTDTILRTRPARDRRLIYLDKGQAFFRVAHDPTRPFIVSAAGRTVTAVGTAFDVRVDPKRFEVTLVEGKVRVEAPGRLASVADPRGPGSLQATEMLAGSQLVSPDAGHWSLARADTAKETSWLHGQLVFEAEPIGDVAAELNRYSDRKIIVEDAAVARRPISGTFKTGDVEAFIRAVEAYRLASVDTDTDEQVRLAAP